MITFWKKKNTASGQRLSQLVIATPTVITKKAVIGILLNKKTAIKKNHKIFIGS